MLESGCISCFAVDGFIQHRQVGASDQPPCGFQSVLAKAVFFRPRPQCGMRAEEEATRPINFSVQFSAPHEHTDGNLQPGKRGEFGGRIEGAPGGAPARRR